MACFHIVSVYSISPTIYQNVALVEVPFFAFDTWIFYGGLSNCRVTLGPQSQWVAMVIDLHTNFTHFCRAFYPCDDTFSLFRGLFEKSNRTDFIWQLQQNITRGACLTLTLRLHLHKSSMATMTVQAREYSRRFYCQEYIKLYHEITLRNLSSLSNRGRTLWGVYFPISWKDISLKIIKMNKDAEKQMLNLPHNVHG